GSLEVWNRSKMLTSDNGEMVNRGNLRKSRYYANAPTEISVPFTNTGTVQLDTMELQIKAGSLWQGNLVVNSGAWLTFSGTESHTFEASANLGGEGWLVLNGEVQQFGTSMTLTNRMEIQRGRTEVSGNLTLPHLSLRGGILAVSGTTTVQDSLNIRILNSARPIVLDGGRLVNLGTGFWNNGDITLGSGAILENAGSGTLDIYNRSDMIPGSGGGSFINRGLITRTRYFANDATGIQVPFTNTGTVRLDTTGLELAVGSTYQGQFEVKPGAWLTLRGDTHTFDVGSTLAGGGVLVFDADGQLLNGNLDLRGQLELRRGVTVRNGDLPVNGFLNFRGGTLRVSGVTSVSDSISFREANSSRPMVIDGGRLLNNSVAYWNSGDITLANGAILDNPAGSVVDIYNRSEILAINGGEFRNAGLIKKERFFHADPSVITARLVNTGMVRVDTSGLNLSYGGSYGGNFEINNGGWLRLFGDQTHTFAVGSTVRGTGTLVLEAAEHHMDGDLLLAGTLELRSGRTLINRDLTLPRLTHRGGALTVSGTLSISDSLSFYYRNSNNPVIIDGGRLLNLRYATWNPGDINLINNAVLENAAGATLDIFTRWDMEGGGAGQFINRGLVKVDRFFEDTPATVRVPFTNLGTVQLDTSGLAFAVSSLNQGEYRINPGGNLYFVGADTHYFAIGSQVGGSGRLSLGAAGHFFEGDLDLNGWIEQRNGLTTYGSDWPMRKLHFRGGVLRIGGRITVADTLVLERLATNVNLALDGCRLVNNGAGEWLPADIVLANGAVLENGATGSLDIFTERRISEVNGGLFENHGLITMNRFYSAVQPRVMVPFLNTGTVRLDSTGFKLLATSSSSGIYDVSGTAILTFGGSGTHRFESGSHLGGTGIVELAADNHLLEGNLDLRGNLVVRWGVTERSGSLETAELTFLGGTVRVADTLQVNDSLYIAATAGPDIIMDGGRLLSNGYGVWESGHLDLANAAVLEIGESGVFDLNSSGNIEPHTGSFILNRGLLRRLPD
nr:hypothetical protein [Calditrichia bacterium]